MITKNTVSMRRVTGAVYRRFLGVDCCVREDEIFDFKRTTIRVWGVAVWVADHDFVEVPMHVFIADCFGTR